MENETIEIILSVKEWNYVLNVLGQRPYGEVAVIVTKMQQQAKERVDAMQARVSE